MTDTLVDEFNAASGWVKDMGIVILTASPDVVAQGRVRLLCVDENKALG
jgi:hypothetical protein